MKLFSVCLITAATSLMLAGNADAQKLKETADPYFQPATTAKSLTPAYVVQPRLNKDTQLQGGSVGNSVQNKTPATRGSEFVPTDSGSSGFKPSGSSTNNGLSDRSGAFNSTTSGHDQRAMDHSHSMEKSDHVTQSDPLPRITPYEPESEQVASTTDMSMECFGPTRVLARVGGHPIFESDLMVEAMQIVDKFIGTAPMNVKQKEVQNLLPRLLPKYIQSKILLVDALDSLPEGAKVEDIYESAGTQFDETMLPRLMENIDVESPAKLDGYYRGLGSSLRKVRQSWVESELVKYMMRSKINVNPDVSHREMYEVYLSNKDEYAVPAKVRWEQLMVSFDKFPNRQAAREAIAEMGHEVVYGAPLTAVAKRSSQGFKAKEGGQQGWTTRGSLVDKDLDNLLFSIESEKLSEIVESRRGFAIIRVLERTEAGFTSFETAQSEIKKKILSDKQEVAFQKYIDKVKGRVPVEIFDPAFVAENQDAMIR